MNHAVEAPIQVSVSKRCIVWGTVTPLPTTTQYVLVSNLCPECQWGDFDFESPGDGRWDINWCAALPARTLLRQAGRSC